MVKRPSSPRPSAERRPRIRRGGIFPASLERHAFWSAVGAMDFRGGVYKEPLERFKKYCSRLVVGEERAVFLSFGFVSAQSQGFQTYSFAEASPKPKNPRSKRLQYFLKRSRIIVSACVLKLVRKKWSFIHICKRHRTHPQKFFSNSGHGWKRTRPSSSLWPAPLS